MPRTESQRPDNSCADCRHTVYTASIRSSRPGQPDIGAPQIQSAMVQKYIQENSDINRQGKKDVILNMQASIYLPEVSQDALDYFFVRGLTMHYVECRPSQKYGRKKNIKSQPFFRDNRKYMCLKKLYFLLVFKQSWFFHLQKNRTLQLNLKKVKFLYSNNLKPPLKRPI